VNYHLQCAIKKLGVAGKHQAVTKAIQFGLM
jgi:DNA-binding CsgD family transcriptional regulator